MFFRLFTLSSVLVNALVIVWNDGPCERNGKWKISPILKEDIVDARLIGASVTKPATLLGESRATVSKVMSAYTNHGKTASANRNSGRK
jgi:hypothetical protein